jgi:hypothetical protein
MPRTFDYRGNKTTDKTANQNDGHQNKQGMHPIEEPYARILWRQFAVVGHSPEVQLWPAVLDWHMAGCGGAAANAYGAQLRP